jgi:hypothetical protein
MAATHDAGFSADEQRLRRQLAALTAASTALVVADNFAEHYRGGFHHRAMWAPIILGPVATATAAAAAALPGQHRFHSSLLAASVAQAAAGAVGFALHCRGIAQRPGGGATQSLFHAWYGPPALAPLQYTGLGLLGVAAAAPATWLRPALRHLGWAGLGRLYVAVTTPPLWAEVTYLHARGGYQHPLMLAPVTLLPAVTFASALAAAHDNTAAAHRAAAALLTVLGAVGTLGHLHGTARQHGGFSRPTAVFNLLTGPPPTAPLQMVTTGLVALAAERIRYRGGRRARG